MKPQLLYKNSTQKQLKLRKETVNATDNNTPGNVSRNGGKTKYKEHQSTMLVIIRGDNRVGSRKHSKHNKGTTE